MTNQEIDQDIDQKVEKDPTNWKAWYIGLIAFLVIQIAVFLWITNSYGA